MSVAVLSSTGQKLMPTSNYRARKLLKSGRAAIKCYRPIFTIRLTSRKEGETQPIEYACDTGYQHVGVSIKSEKHEFVHAQYDMLSNETERHNDRRKYRRTRRNRKWYRKPRFDNRSRKYKEMAPSLRHRRENQINLFESFCKVMPITSATFEMGKFDTQLLQAIADGKPLPEGKDYQQGSKYLFQTEREAVFSRDHYTCQVCGKSVKDGVILHTHHIGYWKGYRSNRISNLLTVCEHCHTAKNHKPGGALWGLEPQSTNLAAATYMSTVRWAIYRELVLKHPEIDIHIQYGAKTSVTRKSLHLAKTHANDAYCVFLRSSTMQNTSTSETGRKNLVRCSHVDGQTAGRAEDRTRISASTGEISALLAAHQFGRIVMPISPAIRLCFTLRGSLSMAPIAKGLA